MEKNELLEGQRKVQRETEIADLKEVMSTQAGRRLVWRLLSDAGVFRMSFHTNYGVVSFNEGQRSIGTALYVEIHEHCFDEYQEMEREARSAASTLQSLQEHEDN